MCFLLGGTIAADRWPPFASADKLENRLLRLFQQDCAIAPLSPFFPPAAAKRKKKNARAETERALRARKKFIAL